MEGATKRDPEAHMWVVFHSRAGIRKTKATVLPWLPQHPGQLRGTGPRARV